MNFNTNFLDHVKNLMRTNVDGDLTDTIFEDLCTKTDGALENI